MQTSNKKVLGISGTAHAGKDTFASILESKLMEHGKTSLKIALATPLKEDCVEFLRRTLNVDAYTQNREEKALIRPLLVWYGDAQRKRTNGRYWIDIANKKIDSTDYEYYIITDIRYDAYEKDELYWLKHEHTGILCHISKWSWASKTGPDQGIVSYKQFVPPANDHEMINDPKIRAQADYVIEWPHVSLEKDGVTELLHHPLLNQYVDDFIAAEKIF